MDHSYTDSDLSMSPTQILERLQVLRQLQLMQRGKLQKQRLQYQDTGENSSSITEIVSQFSNTTSYNTFRSLLQSSNDTSVDSTPRLHDSNLSQKVKDNDLIEGVAVLNLSQESEFIVNSPLSTKSRVSGASKSGTINGSTPAHRISPIRNNVDTKSVTKKQISLDEMPILSPKQDFEALIVEKLKNEKPQRKMNNPITDNMPTHGKKSFLRRGEGMARFGVKKNDLVIQNTKSLPWRQKSLETRMVQSPLVNKQNPQNKEGKDMDNLVTESKETLTLNKNCQPPKPSIIKEKPKPPTQKQEKSKINEDLVDSSNCELHGTNKPSPRIPVPKGPAVKHPLLVNKGKTWAAVLTKEQDDFLRQLKQSEYYKNFVSPAKSIVSDVTCDDNLSILRQEREIAEQNMFELLENKVCNESFHLENSFFNKFLKKKNNLECSGESTPLVFQKCLANNPKLLHIFPDIEHRKRNQNSNCETENSGCTDCCRDDCSSVSSCCSCKTVEAADESLQGCIKYKDAKKIAQKKVQITNPKRKEVDKASETENCQVDNVIEDTIKTDMAEMNAKLIATSELLKERLQELEDEIETFRKENANLAKMREEVDLERQKFYEDKNAFEQKFNEEKILSEYYLAEEKEKLTKQKQMYERYVREMRGRLNKKEKDEFVNLKKEISDLKEEIRIKDAKSTSTIARLRNQLKIMEKDKKDLQNEVEKLKKENRRIQHSNDITRRLTNMKYLEEVNKKLSHISSKDTRSEVDLDVDIKYKAYEIERQSRSRKLQRDTKVAARPRPRAKSVPNLKVTSRYAKYFSQRDAVSQMERDKLFNIEHIDRYGSDNDDSANNEILKLDDTDSIQDDNLSVNESENHLEKIYMERFQTASPTSNQSNLCDPTYTEKHSYGENPDAFFIRKSSNSSIRDSKSPNNSATSPYLQNSNGSNIKSPMTILTHRSNNHNYNPPVVMKEPRESNFQRSKSPASILSNRTSSTQIAQVVGQDHRDKLAVSPEPSTSKSSLAKTNLNPTEIKKPDGSRELRFPNGNIKHISADGKYCKFIYYNGDIKENFYDEGRIKYFYAEAKTFHTTHADGLEVLEFPDGQVEKRYKDGSTEIRLPNGSVRYFDPKNEHVREEWRFPDGTALSVSANGDQRVVFSNGQIEVHTKDHKRREFPDGTVKLVYNDGTSETRYSSGRVRIKDKHGNLIMDSAPG